MFASSLFPRSEVWRFSYSFRTCISVAVISFLLIFPPTQNILNKHCDAGFAAFVTVIVKDITVGSTLVNAWSCIFGSLLASLLALLLLYITTQADILSQPSNDFYNLSLAFILFISVLLLQYTEVQLIGKKLGVSLLAINILQFNRTYTNEKIWQYFVAVLLGCACALVGTIIPLPMQLAGTEVKERLRYCTLTMSFLLKNVTKAWLFQPSLHADVGMRKRIDDNTKSFTPFGPLIDTGANNSVKINEERKSENMGIPEKEFTGASLDISHIKLQNETSNFLVESRHWRMLRLLVQGAAAFKRSKHYHIGWLDGLQRNSKDRYTRIELIQYLEEQLEVLVRRSTEARFGPSRGAAIHIFGRYVSFVRALLTILSLLQKHVSTMEEYPEHLYVYYSFFKNPNFRAALTFMMQAICSATEKLSNVLIAEQTFDEVTIEVFETIHSLSHLLHAQDHLSRVYFTLREQLYFDRRHENHHSNSSNCLPVYADVLFNMNSFLFLIDILCEKLVRFIKPAELKALAASLDELSLTAGRIKHHQENIHYTIQTFLSAMKSILRDLIPSQSHLSCFTFTSHQWSSLTFRITDTIKSRVKNACTVAFAMMMAALYGSYASRPQVFMAAFTIAYLTGGNVAGINIMTCINRAAGTVVACVYSVVVVFIHNSSVFEGQPLLQRFLIGLAIVLFQFPSTYVRSFPVYSYSGSVAGFTTALLLINPDLLLTSVALDRIIDTYVGVAIYLSVELSLFAQDSEDFLFKVRICGPGLTRLLARTVF